MCIRDSLRCERPCSSRNHSSRTERTHYLGEENLYPTYLVVGSRRMDRRTEWMLSQGYRITPNVWRMPWLSLQGLIYHPTSAPSYGERRLGIVLQQTYSPLGERS